MWSCVPGRLLYLRERLQVIGEDDRASTEGHHRGERLGFAQRHLAQVINPPIDPPTRPTEEVLPAQYCNQLRMNTYQIREKIWVCKST